MSEKYNNTGALWENKDYVEGGKYPMYQGTFTDNNGKKWSVSMWKNNQRDSHKYPYFRFIVNEYKSPENRETSQNHAKESNYDDNSTTTQVSNKGLDQIPF